MRKKVLRQIAEVDVALTAACLVGHWAVRHAYAARGSFAVGSEWLLIALVYLGAYLMIRRISKRQDIERDADEKRSDTEKRSGGTDRMRYCR